MTSAPPAPPASVPPAEDGLSTLQKLVRSASDVRAPAGAGEGAKTKQSGLVWGIIAAGIVAVIVAVLGFVAVWARRKAARLQHEINVRDEKILQASERAALTEHEAERTVLEASIEALSKEVDALQLKREELATRSDELYAEFAALTTWDDVEVIRE